MNLYMIHMVHGTFVGAQIAAMEAHTQDPHFELHSVLVRIHHLLWSLPLLPPDTSSGLGTMTLWLQESQGLTERSSMFRGVECGYT